MNERTDPIRALVVADAPAERHGLRRLAGQLPGVAVVGESDGRDGLLETVAELEADLLLVDAARLQGLLAGSREPPAPGTGTGPTAVSHPTRFAVRRPNGRITLVPVEDLLWVEAARDYVRLHTAAGSHLVRDTMSRVEQQLAPDRFVRVHRSTIVRLDAVREIRSDPDGRCLLQLADGSERAVSHTGRKRLQAAVGLSL